MTKTYYELTCAGCDWTQTVYSAGRMGSVQSKANSVARRHEDRAHDVKANERVLTTLTENESPEKVGLYLGKFAPLHKGHQSCIETAMKETDEVIVVIYDEPTVTNTPLPVRADWIRQLYSGARTPVTVIEGWTLPTERGYTDEKKREHEEAIIELLGDRSEEITHFYSSEEYGEHMSNALDAKDRRVDMDRTEVPISATEIRESPLENRQYIDPVVYADLITRVVFLGGPSTGKTTLARELADEFDTAWMSEYGREYWAKNQVDGRLTPEQLVTLATGHTGRERSQLMDAEEYLFVDTNPIYTYAYSHYYHGHAPEELEEMAKECAFTYDVVFLCGCDVPFEDTPDREGVQTRDRLHKHTKAFLQEHNIEYIKLRGSVEERMDTVIDVLNEYEKYASVEKRV